MKHPAENDLALLAGGDAGRMRRFLLNRHLRACPDCAEKVAEYSDLRRALHGRALSDVELPELNWSHLAAEMRANIRLGLEAGACVDSVRMSRRSAMRLWLADFRSSKPWTPGFAVGFASLLLLLGSGVYVRHFVPPSAAFDGTATVLRSTVSGIEIRTGGKSLSLLNHHGDPSNQTVSARGDIETRYIDGETGSVTINNVYLQ